MFTKVIHEVDGTCDGCCTVLEPFESLYRDEENDIQVCGKCILPEYNISPETINEAEKETIAMRYIYYRDKYDEYSKLME